MRTNQVVVEVSLFFLFPNKFELLCREANRGLTLGLFLPEPTCCSVVDVGALVVLVVVVGFGGTSLAALVILMSARVGCD